GQRGAAPRRYRDARARQGDAAARRRIHLRGAAQRACVVPGRGAARAHRRRCDCNTREKHARAQGRRHGGGRRYSGTAAEFLHRLPRTPRIQRPQADAARPRAHPPQPPPLSADIGFHSFATFAPFSLGNSILGYGMSLASAAAVTANMDRRPIAVMGDGGFWHNGLVTGVASNLFNKGDGVLIVMKNGYASATGQPYLP